MKGPRRVEAEWLDSLPADDRRAIGSRHDLKRLNLLMGHAAIIKRALERSWRHGKPRSILEIGAGDGTLMLAVARRLVTRWHDVTITLLDRQQLLSHRSERKFSALGWGVKSEAADVFDFLEQSPARFDVVVANLFLHHFSDEQLKTLFDRISTMARLFVAAEPRRTGRALLATRGLWMLGCNDVTRHDAVSSVRAGFTGSELSKLWPGGQEWEIEERPAGVFSHGFAALRHG